MKNGNKFISKEAKKQLNNTLDLIENEDKKKEVLNKLIEKAKSAQWRLVVLDFFKLSNLFEQLYIFTKNGLEISHEGITRGFNSKSRQ